MPFLRFLRPPQRHHEVLDFTLSMLPFVSDWKTSGFFVLHTFNILHCVCLFILYFGRRPCLLFRNGFCIFYMQSCSWIMCTNLFAGRLASTGSTLLSLPMWGLAVHVLLSWCVTESERIQKKIITQLHNNIYTDVHYPVNQHKLNKTDDVLSTRSLSFRWRRSFYSLLPRQVSFVILHFQCEFLVHSLSAMSLSVRWLRFLMFTVTQHLVSVWRL